MTDRARRARTRLGPAAAPEKRELRPGAFVGRYALLRRIGTGGMGEVWEAVDPAVTEPVALKLLTFDLGSSAMQRFVRESNVARAVEHPNVVPTIDTGWWNGSPFLVMPLVRGTSLSELARREGRMTLERVVSLLDGVARALDALHEAGVVHRDVKPSNLLVTDEGDTVLLDFGLATLGEDHLRLTRPGTVSGSPHYMSPEAAFGHVPDARGDVYSLAAVAYRLLAGRPPIMGRDSIEVLSAKLSRTPPRLSSSGGPPSRALDALLTSALSRDPSRRPASAGALLDQLRAIASRAEPSRSRGASPPSSSPRTSEKPRIALRANDFASFPQERVEAPAPRPPDRSELLAPATAIVVSIALALVVALLLGS